MNTIYLKSFFLSFIIVSKHQMCRWIKTTKNEFCIPKTYHILNVISQHQSITIFICMSVCVCTRWTHVKKTKEKYEKMPTNQMQMFEVLLYACFQIKKWNAFMYVCVVAAHIALFECHSLFLLLCFYLIVCSIACSLLSCIAWILKAKLKRTKTNGRRQMNERSKE